MLEIMAEMPKSGSVAEFNGTMLRVMSSIAAVLKATLR